MKEYISNLTRTKAVVMEYFGISSKDLFKKDRKREFTYPRQVFHYLAHKNMGIPTMIVGSFSNRDHATVLHSCKKIDEWRSYDKDVINDIRILSDKVSKVSKIEMLATLLKEFWKNLIKILKV